MEIKRDLYLNQLKESRFDGQVKVITGIRRVGKSYLLKKLYGDYLISDGVSRENIIDIELDRIKDIRFRDPLYLAEYVRGIVKEAGKEYYLFVDEIQMSDKVKNPYNPLGAPITFYDALNDLKSIPNLDIYVTGSNSKMLSSDILTEFRGRSNEIRLHPLSFSEFYGAYGKDKRLAMDEYSFYGGMPYILNCKTDGAKTKYLQSLFNEVYIKDIVERNKIIHIDALEAIIDLLCSQIGSLTNTLKIANTLKTVSRKEISVNTVKSYIGHLKDAFLFSESKRFEIRGKEYLASLEKYYAEDIGLRNARIGFRQQEMTHIMENIVFNELVYRGYSVDIGVVYSYSAKDGSDKTPLEIDFVATKGNEKFYVQSAYAMANDEKVYKEKRPFALTRDTFPKIIVRRDIGKPWYDEDGVLNISLEDFCVDFHLR